MFYKIKFNKSFNSELYLNSYKRKNMDLEDTTLTKYLVLIQMIKSKQDIFYLQALWNGWRNLKTIRDDVKLRVFIDNIMYVAVNSGKDFFEPKANKDLSDFNNILPYYLEIEYLVEIVEILNLNLKIWN